MDTTLFEMKENRIKIFNDVKLDPAMVTPGIFLGSASSFNQYGHEYSTVISVRLILTEDDLNLHPNRKWVRLDDTDLDDLLLAYGTAEEYMRDATPEKPALIHCQVGASRSASMALLYLMLVDGRDPLKAWLGLLARRPTLSPNRAFKLILADISCKLSEDVDGRLHPFFLNSYEAIRQLELYQLALMESKVILL
jgi:Dual specificity phosphatase, catalytic domain